MKLIFWTCMCIGAYFLVTGIGQAMIALGVL